MHQTKLINNINKSNININSKTKIQENKTDDSNN